MSTSSSDSEKSKTSEQEFYDDIGTSTRYARGWWQTIQQLRMDKKEAEQKLAESEKKLAAGKCDRCQSPSCVRNRPEKKQAAAEEKTLDEVYSQRTDYFLLAMALAQRAGWRASWREKEGEWVVLVIKTPEGEVSIHAKTNEVPKEVFEWGPASPWDNSTALEHKLRIRLVMKRSRNELMEEAYTMPKKPCMKLDDFPRGTRSPSMDEFNQLKARLDLLEGRSVGSFGGGAADIQQFLDYNKRCDRCFNTSGQK